MTTSDLLAILPLIVLIAWALALLLVDLWVPGPAQSGSPLSWRRLDWRRPSA